MDIMDGVGCIGLMRGIPMRWIPPVYVSHIIRHIIYIIHLQFHAFSPSISF